MCTIFAAALLWMVTQRVLKTSQSSQADHECISGDVAAAIDQYYASGGKAAEQQTSSKEVVAPPQTNAKQDTTGVKTSRRLDKKFECVHRVLTCRSTLPDCGRSRTTMRTYTVFLLYSVLVNLDLLEQHLDRRRQACWSIQANSWIIKAKTYKRKRESHGFRRSTGAWRGF